MLRVGCRYVSEIGIYELQHHEYHFDVIAQKLQINTIPNYTFNNGSDSTEQKEKKNVPPVQT